MKPANLRGSHKRDAAIADQTILVADDEAAIRKLIVKLLAANGFRTLEAKDGLEAVQLYTTHRANIALVITEVQMPVMDGFEALERMQAINPDVRVIIITGRCCGFGRPDLPIRCWIDKPFTPRELLESVRLVLSG